MDQPSDSARSNPDAGAGRPALQFGTEWKDGLSRLITNLEAELERAVQAAHREASDAVKGIESQGLSLLTVLDQRQTEAEAAEAAAAEEIRQKRATAERETAAMVADAEQRAARLIADAEEQRRAAEAERTAVQERVTQIQAGIDAAEEELRQNREDAEREAAEAVAAARRRAESIIARAEAQADEIVNEARAEAAARRGQSGAGRSASDPAPEGGRGGLRDLSARVGALLNTPGGAAVGTTAVAGLGAAVVPVASSRSSTDVEPVEPSEAASPAEPEALAAPEHGAAEHDEEVPTREVPSWSAASEPATASEPPTSSSGAPEDHGDAPAAAAFDAAGTPSAAASSGPEPHQDPEPMYMRRAPQPEPAIAYEAPEPELAPTPVEASHREPDEPVATADDGPSGAVTQTIIFQAVPNFQAALALERSLKAMAEVREVRVADFDERQLTFQVTHELGAQLPRVLLSQRAGELEFVEARPERVEFVFRS